MIPGFGSSINLKRCQCYAFSITLAESQLGWLSRLVPVLMYFCLFSQLERRDGQDLRRRLGDEGPEGGRLTPGRQVRTFLRVLKGNLSSDSLSLLVLGSSYWCSIFLCFTFSPVPTFLICAAFVLAVKVVGPWLMRDRPAFSLKRFLVAYNAFQVALSTYIFVQVIAFVLTVTLDFTSVSSFEDFKPLYLIYDLPPSKLCLQYFLMPPSTTTSQATRAEHPLRDLLV